MQKILTVGTDAQEGLFDITEAVKEVVKRSNIIRGTASIYVQGNTAGILIQEHWDNSVSRDIVTLLERLVPKGIWEHDRHNGNGDAHLKATLIGPEKTIPVINGLLGLSTWQNIFLCEFDGPREFRNVVVTITEC